MFLYCSLISLLVPVHPTAVISLLQRWIKEYAVLTHIEVQTRAEPVYEILMDCLWIYIAEEGGLEQLSHVCGTNNA